MAHADPSVLRANQDPFQKQQLSRSCSCRATMQADGNLVTYASRNSAWWASNTVGRGGSLVMEPDANRVVFEAGGALWSSGLVGEALGGAPRSDIRSIELSQARARWCGNDCAQDARCRAWTYVPRASRARCRPRAWSRV